MGHIQDRWFRPKTDPATGDVLVNARGKPVMERTELYGVGKRYKARYFDPDGNERSRSFPDRQKKAAEDFLIAIENDKREGKYLDRSRGRMSLREFAEQWRAAQTFDYTTRDRIGGRLKVQVYPFFEGRSIGSVRPSDIQAWQRWLQDRGVSQNYRVLLFTHVASIFNAAIDDKRILENPCHAKSVSRPRVEQKTIEVWSHERAWAMHAALADRFKIVVPVGAGCGLRQGEVFGLSPDDLDREAEVVNVVRQIRLVENKPVFAPPKRGKTRSVPLPSRVARELDEYAKRFPPTELTLPWLHPGGTPTTVRVYLIDYGDRALRRGAFNSSVWRPALVKAGVTGSTRDHGMHALRHLYASVLLDAGESVKALAQYLGHSDPGFTLRVYTHLLPTSHERTRRAVDGFLGEKKRAA